MPIVKVFGLPQTLTKPQFVEVLKDLRRKIISAVLGVSELKLTEEKEVSVYLLNDFLPHTEASELVVEITGLFEKPEHTEEVRNKLAASVGIAVTSLYPRALVECFVEPFNQNKGFWSSRAQ